MVMNQRVRDTRHASHGWQDPSFKSRNIRLSLFVMLPGGVPLILRLRSVGSSSTSASVVSAYASGTSKTVLMYTIFSIGPNAKMEDKPVSKQRTRDERGFSLLYHTRGETTNWITKSRGTPKSGCG